MSLSYLIFFNLFDLKNLIAVLFSLFPSLLALKCFLGVMMTMEGTHTHVYFLKIKKPIRS